MEVGDILYSKNNFERNGIYFYVNRPYRVSGFLGYSLFTVRNVNSNGQEVEVFFAMPLDYGLYFLNQSDYRKEKIKQLDEQLNENR